MVAALARMERRGVSIDRDMLSRLAGDFAQSMARLEAEISRIVGGPFNPGSPKQLGDILFGQMGLAGGKKTATGAWSTTASVLNDLAAEGHELPARVLEWRQLSKGRETAGDRAAAAPQKPGRADDRARTRFRRRLRLRRRPARSVRQAPFAIAAEREANRSVERFVLAGRSGVWRTAVDLGSRAFRRLVIGHVSSEAVSAAADGILVGVARDGSEVAEGDILAELELRIRQATWTGMDRSARATAKAVMRAISEASNEPSRRARPKRLAQDMDPAN